MSMLDPSPLDIGRSQSTTQPTGKTLWMVYPLDNLPRAVADSTWSSLRGNDATLPMEARPDDANCARRARAQGSPGYHDPRPAGVHPRRPRHRALQPTGIGNPEGLSFSLPGSSIRVLEGGGPVDAHPGIAGRSLFIVANQPVRSRQRRTVCMAPRVRHAWAGYRGGWDGFSDCPADSGSAPRCRARDSRPSRQGE